jgi:hypothetical protein
LDEKVNQLQVNPIHVEQQEEIKPFKPNSELPEMKTKSEH